MARVTSDLGYSPASVNSLETLTFIHKALTQDPICPYLELTLVLVSLYGSEPVSVEGTD